MSLLIDLLLDVIGSGVGPSTDRGLVATFSAGSIALTAVTAWLVVTSHDPITQPEWALTVLAGSILCGAGGVLVSLTHLRRNESDRLFGFLSLTLNSAAVAIPLAWMVAH